MPDAFVNFILGRSAQDLCDLASVGLFDGLAKLPRVDHCRSLAKAGETTSADATAATV